MLLKHIVLVGAGHTHVLALARIAHAAQRQSSRVTLVCGDQYTPYSGLVPSVIAGLVHRRAMLLDVASLARRCKVDFEQQNAAGIDLQLRQVILESGARINYDHLSINIGGTNTGAIREEGGDVMAVKPIVPFINWLDRWNDQSRATVAVVGGGVAGAEVALTIDARLRRRKRYGGVYIIGRSATLIPERPQLAVAVQKLLCKRGISQVLGATATAASPGYVQLADGSEHPADHVVCCTGVQAWPGIKRAGFAVDKQGFLLVNSRLQSVSHPEVLACGDCVTVTSGHHVKSGVLAVRQAVILADNMIAKLNGRKLKPWLTSKHKLAIICTGDQRAIADRNGIVVNGRLMWWWKCYLDKRFMHKFS